MYKLSEAATHDIEQLLDQSILDFGLLQTEAYYHDLTHCLSLLADNPESIDLMVGRVGFEPSTIGLKVSQ